MSLLYFLKVCASQAHVRAGIPVGVNLCGQARMHARDLVAYDPKGISNIACQIQLYMESLQLENRGQRPNWRGRHKGFLRDHCAKEV